MSSTKNLIKLSLCGVNFVCSKETLSRSEYFKNIFDEYKDVDFTKEELYLERSPVIFKHILSLLINEKYPFPDKYKDELKYFLMAPEEEKVKDKPKLNVEKKDKPKLNIENNNRPSYCNKCGKFFLECICFTNPSGSRCQSCGFQKTVCICSNIFNPRPKCFMCGSTDKNCLCSYTSFPPPPSSSGPRFFS